MDTKKMLRAMLFTPGPNGHWGVPILIEGEPGSAKSATIEALAAECGLHAEVVIASLREPADFLGLPIPTTESVRYLPTSWAQRLSAAGRGVAFLDELNTAPEAVQAALLRVVLDRVVGDLELPSTVRIIAAQNAVEDAAGGHDLSMPLANRFLHWSWEAPDASAWVDWLLSGAGSEDVEPLDPEKEEERVLTLWPSAFAAAQGLVAGFIRRRPELLHQKPKAGDPKASKAWPSRRTWDMATRVLGGARVHGLSEAETEMLMAGCVGAGAAAEFAMYQAEMDLPDPAALLDGKVKWAPDQRLDRTVAVLGACAALVHPADAEKRNARASALWQLLAPIVASTADIAIPALKALASGRLTGLPEAKPVLVALNPVLKAAGILR